MFKLTLLTPEKKVALDQEIDFVVLPTANGEIDILKGHAPLVTTLSTGPMRWKTASDAKTHYAVVSWGYAEVYPEGVHVLADILDFPEDIKPEEATKKLQEAEKKLSSQQLEDKDWDEVHRQWARARAHLDIKH